MVPLDSDLDQMLAEYQANATSLEEIMRVLRRLPYLPSEAMYASEIVAKWQTAGRDIAMAPLDPGYHARSPAECHAAKVAALKQGILFVASGDHGFEMVVVKVDAGRGLFGGQKVKYACFVRLSDDEAYQPIGGAKTLTGAMIKMSNAYRIGSALP